ncbi:MAG: hypothetical protein AAGD35_04945 [Actinomycetota bacterium]
MAEPSKPPVALPAWERREPPGAFSVEETARRVGHYKWIEMRIFELMGTWTAMIPEVDIKPRLGTHCYHHAFHAELWHKRLPELREVNPERLTIAPNAEMEALVDALAVLDEPERTIEKLVGFYRVLLPHLIAVYTFHRNRSSRLGDAPTIRSLTFCLNDDMEQWREGEMILQSLITTPEQVQRAATRQAELTTMLLAAGGVAGPGSIGFFDLDDGDDTDDGGGAEGDRTADASARN